MANEPQAQQAGQTPAAPKTPQPDPAEAYRQQMAGYIANLQQQLADTNHRLDQQVMDGMDDLDRANYVAQKERERAEGYAQQLQNLALQQRREQDIQRLAATFKDIGVDVEPADLMDATDVLDAVQRAAAKAKVAIPNKVRAEVDRISESDANNAPYLGTGQGSPSADDAIAAAKKSGNPAAVIAAIKAKYNQ